ncbi:MAG TPA: hypothetical protein VFF83_09470 [Clostridia bacterium]|nr:hypothetical protein [Clostridia bacterium]
MKPRSTDILKPLLFLRRRHKEVLNVLKGSNLNVTLIGLNSGKTVNEVTILIV